jgi:hypothetical protein
MGSLALFALGGADLAGGFCLRTLRFGRPTWGLFWIQFSYQVRPLRRSGHVVRGVGQACKCGFTVPFTMFFKGPLLRLLSYNAVGL